MGTYSFAYLPTRSKKENIEMKLFNAFLAASAIAQNATEFGFDEEHKKQWQSLVIKDFDASMDKLLDTFFVSVKRSKAFRENQQKIIKQDRALCEAGEDERGEKVRCREETVIKMSYQTPAKKYRLLKLISAWLQDDADFDKYTYYGCHCFPTGMDEMNGGHGEPMDKIDRSCKLFFQCYECAKMADETCDGLSQKYSLKLNTHTTTLERTITCVDDEGTCARNTCECDRRLAENLHANSASYSTQYHTLLNEGAWSFNNQCQRRVNEKKYGKATECCGDSFPDMIPKQEGKSCCGYRPFDPAGDRQCCEPNKLRPQCN